MGLLGGGECRECRYMGGRWLLGFGEAGRFGMEFRGVWGGCWWSGGFEDRPWEDEGPGGLQVSSALEG